MNLNKIGENDAIDLRERIHGILQLDDASAVLLLIRGSHERLEADK